MLVSRAQNRRSDQNGRAEGFRTKALHPLKLGMAQCTAPLYTGSDLIAALAFP